MATFKVEVVNINKVEPHPNAERLELAHINGWTCVVAKDQFKSGDPAVYIPIDSILPLEIETKIFGPNSKIKLTKSRVKTIRLRGIISQGLLTTAKLLDLQDSPTGTDVTAKLGITKFEPEVPSYQQNMPGSKKAKSTENPHFSKYGGLDNGKHYPELFTAGEEVIVTEKIHGSHIRAGKFLFVPSTLIQKVMRFLGLTPKFQWCYGSNNVQLQSKWVKSGYYGEDIYGQVLKKYNIQAILKDNEAIHGELYGDGIQKNYTYGCSSGEFKLIIFDVKVNGEYLATDAAKLWCEERNLEYVPILYRGPYSFEKVRELTLGNSVLAPNQKVREGVVVKPVLEEKSYIGRKVLKFISDEYLLSDQTDFH